MALASSEELATWLRANADKRGTPDYQTVLRGFQEAVIAESRAASAAPAAPAGPKESTIFGEIARGGKQLFSTSRTGIGALVSPEEAARAGVERGQQIAAEAGEGPSFAALRKVYEERGLLPAAGELASQIPRAVAGQLPQLAALAGGAKLGAMAGTAVAPGVGTIAGGILGAGATLLPQFFGANVERQAAEQMERGEPVKIDRGTAAAAAAGQAGIESVGTALVLGKRMVKGILGVTDDAGLATAKARADLVKAAERSRLGAAGRGAAVGLAEIPVEVAQAVIERAQAGLDVMSPEAFTEYGENAYLAGLVGPTIGAATRVTEPGAARKKLAAEEQVKAGEARKAAQAAEEAKKKSPEYLLDLEARYQAAMQQKAKLDAAIVKPPKDADPATKLLYRDAVRVRDEFAKTEMAEVAREYATRKKDIDVLNQQRGQEAELAAQAVPQAEQKLPYYESAQGTIPGLEAVETPVIEEEAPVDYARQVRLLKQQLKDIQTQAETTTDLATKLQLSKSYAQTQKALADAQKEAKAEGKGGIEALRKQMATAESKGDLEAQGKLAQQLLDLGVTDLGAQAELDLGRPQALGKLQVPSDMADYQAAQQRAAEAKAAREAQQRQQQQLAKEAYERSLQTADLYSGVAAQQQRRAADRAAADAEAKAETERTQREEEMVGKLVQATGAVQPQPVPQARMALPTGETTEGLYDQATELRAQLAFAQQTRNKNLESRVRQQLQQLGESTEEKGTALDLGATAREAGVEGELTPDAMAQNRLTRLAQRQLMSYDQLVKFITQAREREQTTVDEKTKAQYKYRAEQLKQAAIGFALQEINGRRQQYGLPVLEQKEAMRAVTGLARPLNELIARGAQMFEEPVVVRGQQRGIRLVEGAQEFERPPAGKRTFPEAGFPAAADTLREEFRKTVETVSGVPAAPAPAAFGKPPGPVRKVVPEQRELFLTPPPAEEPVSTAPTALLDKAANKAASADDARLLRQMQEIYTQLTPEQQSVVREQAQRAVDGKPLDAVYEMRGLYQLQQREAATAAGQQTFLKPITLVTARRKIERLAQQAAALEKQAAEAQAIVERIAAGRKSEIERAQAAFDRAREQGKDLIATASQLRMEQTKERLDAANKIAELELKKRGLDKEWDDVVAGQFAWLQTRYEFLREEVAAGRAPKTNRAELAQLEKIYPGAIDRVVKASKALDRINKKIAAAKEAQQSVLERQAADTVTGSLLKQATKAQNKIDAAQQKLSEARAAEKAAERVHKATLAAEPKAPTPLEQVEAIPITGVTRVFRDTSDPAVQAQATKKRSAIAREEGTYAILEERLKAAEGDDRVNLQRQLNESEARLQKLHTELYDVYGNAPLKRVQGETVEAAASAERLEKAQHAVQDAEIDAFNAKHDTARLSLPPRKAGPMISERGVVKQGGERVIKAEPTTPIAEIASTRKRIDEINQQFAYIKANPAKSAEGKAKQAKVKTQLAAERQTLAAKLKELLQSQREVVREEKAVEKELKGARTVSKGAIKRSKLEASDAQLFEDLAKATKTKEQAALFERAENAFGEMSAPDQAFVRRQANALVGRREADYQGARLAEVVAAAERRMAREGEIEFSRGKPAEGLTKAELIAELERALGQKGLLNTQNVLTVVESVADLKSLKKLPPALRDNLDAIPDDAKGFVYDGKAYLIAENIGKDHALGVLLHEVGAHIGFRNFFNTAQYNALVETVKRWSKSKANTLEAKIGRAAMERVKAAETSADQVNDELLAYAVEEAFNAGVEPAGVKGGNAVQNWLRMIVDGFKRALEKFGLAPQNLKVGDLVNMAYGAANLELRGTWHGTGKPFKEFDFAYMGSGEGAQVYGWGTYRAQSRGVAQYYKQLTSAQALYNAIYSNFTYKGKTFEELLQAFDKKRTPPDEQFVLGYLENLEPGMLDYFDVKNKTELEENLKEAFDREVQAANRRLQLNKRASYDTSYDKQTLKEIAAVDYAEFDMKDYAAFSNLGALARVLSTTPDDAYFVLDLPLSKQSDYVKSVAADFVNAVTDKRMREGLQRIMDNEGTVPEALPNKIQRFLRVSDAEGTSRTLRGFGLAGYKYLDQKSRGRPIGKDSKFNYVDFYDKDEGPAIVAWDIDRVGPAEGILFSRNLPTAARVADNLIAKEKGVIQNLKDNFLGMGFRAQFVDKLAPVEEAFKKGGIDTTKALQAMYYLRMYDQRMHFTSQAISDGVPEIVEKARKDGGTERLIETKPGANISQVVDILKGKDVVKAAGSADGANRLFTLYLAAIRAERVGMDALNFGGKVTEADLKAARAEIEANPTLKNAFDEARDIYNQYNRNLIEFAVQTGALAKSEAKALLASNDYVPYYRMRDGVAQLIVGKETPIRIGNLKDSPHLKELVGGDEAIFDFLTSSVQNTAMLLDMSMKNLATKNAMFELRDVGLATVSKVPKSGKTPDGAVTFKRDGEDYFASVDTDTLGIDSDLLVKGLAGIPTMFPSFVRLLGIPARFLRRVVVASPVYMARQLFRDSLAASMTSGANLVPVLDSLKQIGKPKALGARGITGGQVFTGMPEDVTRMLKDMQAGKVSVTSGLAWLEAKSAQADALTREAQYQSYRDQGLSEMEATYMALESMNFSKRGLSPTVHMVSTLIPFFNAQIQGLDVLYKAFTKQMPMNERLAIREKLWTCGLLLAGMSVAYAMAMQDDETYKNARPEEKYGNWFVPVPGFDQMVRLPIPFELGYVFKALPEAIVNTLANEEGGAEALKAGTHIVKQMVPGLSNYFLPQAVKPALETLLGTSIFTGRSIESSREQMVEPGFRYRDNTTELAKEVGELTGFSPVKMEYLIRGYTGGMGIALLQALSAPFGSSGPEGATKRLSDLPILGTLFQPNDASGIIDATYERMKQVNQVKETYEGLMEKGRTADAQKYIATRMDEMALASVAGSFREYMGQITEFERGIRASSMTPDQKREKLDQARQMKIKLAESVRAVADRKTPQASPA